MMSVSASAIDFHNTARKGGESIALSALAASLSMNVLRACRAEVEGALPNLQIESVKQR